MINYSEKRIQKLMRQLPKKRKRHYYVHHRLIELLPCNGLQYLRECDLVYYKSEWNWPPKIESCATLVEIVKYNWANPTIKFLDFYKTRYVDIKAGELKTFDGLEGNLYWDSRIPFPAIRINKEIQSKIKPPP